MIKIDKNQWVDKIEHLRLKRISLYPNGKLTGTWFNSHWERGTPVYRWQVFVNNYVKDYKQRSNALKHIKMICDQLQGGEEIYNEIINQSKEGV